LTFSSGSTGAPKAAVRSHGFLAAQHDTVRGFLDAQDGDVHLSAFAIVLLSTLVDGNTAVIGRTRRPDARAIARHGVTVVSGSPAFLAPLAPALRAVRRVVSGGAPVPVELAEQLPQLRVVYGSTEAEPIAWIDAAEVRATAAATRAGAGLCVGRPDPHLRVELLAPTTGPIAIGPGGLPRVAPGEVGEVVVAGAHVNQRYWRNPAAERAHKIRDADGTIWHRTGDLAYVDGDGRLWLVGRVADRVRRGDATDHPPPGAAGARALPWVSRAALIDDGGAALLVVEGRGPAGELTAHLAARGVVVDRVAFTRRLPVDPRHHAKLDYPSIRRKYA
jgi:acyl-CoA synthetase (AMP-forming)/AMP-acid ligase II